MSRAVYGPNDGPNSIITTTWPSLHGHTICTSMPAIEWPPLMRWNSDARTAPQDVALGGQQHRALRRHVHVLAASAALPLGEGDERAARGVTGGVEEGLGLRGAHGRTVGVAGEHELAAGGEHREVGRRPGGLRAGGAEALIDTVTSDGLAAQRPRSTGRRRTRAPRRSAARAPPAGPGRAVSRSSTTLRLPRFQPQNVSDRSGSTSSPANGAIGAHGAAARGFDEHHVGAKKR